MAVYDLPRELQISFFLISYDATINFSNSFFFISWLFKNYSHAQSLDAGKGYSSPTGQKSGSGRCLLEILVEYFLSGKGVLWYILTHSEHFNSGLRI